MNQQQLLKIAPSKNVKPSIALSKTYAKLLPVLDHPIKVQGEDYFSVINVSKSK